MTARFDNDAILTPINDAVPDPILGFLTTTRAADASPSAATDAPGSEKRLASPSGPNFCVLCGRVVAGNPEEADQ